MKIVMKEKKWIQQVLEKNTQKILLPQWMCNRITCYSVKKYNSTVVVRRMNSCLTDGKGCFHPYHLAELPKKIVCVFLNENLKKVLKVIRKLIIYSNIQPSSSCVRITILMSLYNRTPRRLPLFIVKHRFSWKLANDYGNSVKKLFQGKRGVGWYKFMKTSCPACAPHKRCQKGAYKWRYFLGN